MTDGLDALEQTRRNRPAGRAIPPSRHKARSTPTKASELTGARPSGEQREEVDSVDNTPPALPKASKRSSISDRRTEVEDKASPSTIYLGAAQADYLQEVYIAGLQRKVDASKSAVARLAIDRLQEQMSPEEIIASLSKRPTTARTGRPRR